MAVHAEKRQCPNGHPMDPNWTECPYCRASAEKDGPTHSEGRGPRQTSGAGRRADTQIGTAPGQPPKQGGSRQTQAYRGQPGPGRSGGGSSDRKIVAMLVTYTWDPAGTMHPIREGKNFIGSGQVASEASHRDCDIMVGADLDPQMSGEHAVILCRHGRYEIVDQRSQNGTYVNDEWVELNGAKLPNYARIRTGQTLWTFAMTHPEGEVVQPEPQQPPRPPSGGGGKPPREPEPGPRTVVK